MAMLGVWKAGGAFVPLDPDYPADRLAFMEADSGLSLVLTPSLEIGDQPVDRPSAVIKLEQLAYVI